MPINETTLPQTVTHWAAGSLAQFGNPSWTGPTELSGMWQEIQELTVNSEGQEIVSNAVVFLTTDVSVGDYLKLGSDASSSPPSDAWEVKNFTKTRSMLENSTFDRKATL